MKDITDKNGYWGYDDLIESFELTVVTSQQFGSYQGDYLIVLEDDARYGWLVFGYGSCSGCDAAEGCNSVGEATELRDELFNDIHWEDDKKGLVAWLRDRDWKGQWSYYEFGFEQALAAIDGVLSDD